MQRSPDRTVRFTGLRRLAAAAAAAVGLGAATADANAAPLTPLEHDILDAVNETRAEHGAPPVRVDAALERAARAHSTDMVRRHYFAHGAFARRLWRFGATGPTIGENLGWCTSRSRAAVFLIDHWLKSPRHRAVLLRRGFNRIGIGVAGGTVAGNEDAVVVTTDYEGK